MQVCFCRSDTFIAILENNSIVCQFCKRKRNEFRYRHDGQWIIWNQFFSRTTTSQEQNFGTMMELTVDGCIQVWVRLLKNSFPLQQASFRPRYFFWVRLIWIFLQLYKTTAKRTVEIVVLDVTSCWRKPFIKSLCRLFWIQKWHDKSRLGPEICSPTFILYGVLSLVLKPLANKS